VSCFNLQNNLKALVKDNVFKFIESIQANPVLTNSKLKLKSNDNQNLNLQRNKINHPFQNLIRHTREK
jgi:hypothetical protein